MDLLLVGVNARLNTWNREFYDALESKGVREFRKRLGPTVSPC
jgi:putative ATP-binding cassette transporter